MHELEELRIENINEGLLLSRANEELARIATDVIDRYYLNKPRTLTIAVDIIPDVDPETGVNMPVIQAKVKASLPAVTCRQTIGVVENERIFVNPGDPVNPNQTTMFHNVTQFEGGLEAENDMPDAAESG